jgi:hypothetical protein
MDREARRALVTAVADLRAINQEIDRTLPQTTGTVRDDLLEMQQRSDAAIRYYSFLLARSPRPNAPAIADRVAEAAFGGNCIGLVPPQFALPTNGTH